MAKKNKIIKCKRCGKCCIVADIENDKWYSCPYLVKYIGGSTFCLIYRHRIEAIIGKQQYCDKREKWRYNIPGCPYNKIGLNIHPAYK